MAVVDRFMPRLLIFGALVTTLAISPWNYDPTGVPKMSIIVSIAVIGLVGHLFKSKSESSNLGFEGSLLYYSLIALVFLFSLNLIVNRYAFSERLFGLSGRHTGYITYVSFAVICFLSSRYLVQSFAVQLLKTLYIGGFLVAIYYLFQRAGFDFMAINSLYGRPSSSLGNPNFVSGFIGLTSSIPFFLYWKNRSRRNLLLGIAGIGFGTLTILDSQSVQGIFALGFTLMVFSGILIFKFRRKRFWLFSIVILSIAILSVFGFLNRGPLAPLLATTTLISRFDYWRTAISMTLSNPLFGVGLDGYGDFYRMYRDEAAAERFGNSHISDTPHNMFLDFFTSGGLPLGLVLLFIVSCVYIQTLKRLIQSVDIDYHLLALFAVLNGHLIQSLISPNQLGIGVWLWILLGALWSMSRVAKVNLGKTKKSLQPHPKHLSVAKKTLGILLFMALPLGYLPFAKDSAFLDSIRTSDGARLLKDVQTFPKDTKRLLLVEQAYKSGALDQIALQVARTGIEHNPNSYRLWRALAANGLTSDELKERAKIEMRRLEPLHGAVCQDFNLEVDARNGDVECR